MLRRKGGKYVFVKPDWKNRPWTCFPYPVWPFLFFLRSSQSPPVSAHCETRLERACKRQIFLISRILLSRSLVACSQPSSPRIKQGNEEMQTEAKRTNRGTTRLCEGGEVWRDGPLTNSTCSLTYCHDPCSDMNLMGNMPRWGGGDWFTNQPGELLCVCCSCIHYWMVVTGAGL